MKVDRRSFIKGSAFLLSSLLVSSCVASSESIETESGVNIFDSKFRLPAGIREANIGQNSDLKAVLMLSYDAITPNGKLEVTLKDESVVSPMMISLPNSGEIVTKTWLDCVRFDLAKLGDNYYLSSEVNELKEPPVNLELLEAGFTRRFKRYPLFDLKKVYSYGRQDVFLVSNTGADLKLVLHGSQGAHNLSYVLERPSESSPETLLLVDTPTGLLELRLKFSSEKEGPYLKTNLRSFTQERGSV